MPCEGIAEPIPLLQSLEGELRAPSETTISTTLAPIIDSCDRVANIPPEAYAVDEPLPVTNRAYGFRKLSLRPTPSLKRPYRTSAFTNEELRANILSSEASSLVESQTQAQHQERSESKWHREFADATSTTDAAALQEPQKTSFQSRFRIMKDSIVSRVSNFFPRFRKKYDHLDNTSPSDYLQRAKYEAGKNKREADRNSIPSLENDNAESDIPFVFHGPVGSKTPLLAHRSLSSKAERRRDYEATAAMREYFWTLPPQGSSKSHSCNLEVRETEDGCDCSVASTEWENESVGRYWA